MSVLLYHLHFFELPNLLLLCKSLMLTSTSTSSWVSLKAISSVFSFRYSFTPFINSQFLREYYFCRSTSSKFFILFIFWYFCFLVFSYWFNFSVIKSLSQPFIPLKISENERFSDVLRGYRIWSAAWNSLINMSVKTRFKIVKSGILWYFSQIGG